MSGQREKTTTAETPFEAIVGLAKLAEELTQYASYAEIVKMIGVNQAQIRDVCDRIIALNQDLEKMLDAAGVPMFDEDGRLLLHARRFEYESRRAGDMEVEKSRYGNAVALKEALAENEKLRGAADRIAPYLIYTIGDESPGHQPTMPSAVGAFLDTFGIRTAEERLQRVRARLASGPGAKG